MLSVFPVFAASKAHRVPAPFCPHSRAPAFPLAPLEGTSATLREGGGVTVFAGCFADPAFPPTQRGPAMFAQERMAEVAPNSSIQLCH